MSSNHLSHAMHVGHLAEYALKKAEHERGVKGAAYRAAGSAGSVVALGMAFALPISLPVLAGAAVLGALFGSKKTSKH